MQSLRRMAVAAALLAFVVPDIAQAADGGCQQIDAAAASSILGVPAVRGNVNQGQHSKLPPDNMDLLTCGYVESSRNVTARTLSYSVYTPIHEDLANVFKSLSSGNYPGAQSFSPGVGQSTGWYRGNQTGGLFEGSLALLTSNNIVTIKIAGLPSSAAVQNALITAAKRFLKP